MSLIETSSLFIEYLLTLGLDLILAEIKWLGKHVFLRLAPSVLLKILTSVFRNEEEYPIVFQLLLGEFDLLRTVGRIHLKRHVFDHDIKA